MSRGILLAFAAGVSIAALFPSYCSQDCPHWKPIVESPEFQRYVLAATESAHLDIAVPKSFDHDDIHLFNQFLKRTPVSLRSFTLDNGFCGDYKCWNVRSNRRVLLSVICRSTSWKVLWNVLANPYVSYLCVIAANYRNVTNLTLVDHLLRHYYIHRIRGSGVFNFTVSRGQILVTVLNEEHCLNCSEVPEALLPRQEDLPLEGVDVRAWCLRPYACEHPAFEILGELFRHRNASFRSFEFGINSTPFFIAVGETYAYPAAMLYFPTHAFAGAMFPASVVPFYYTDSGYSFFVDGLKPYSKEMVLVLPFSLLVWLISMSCFVVCILMTLVIRRVLGGSSKSAPIYPFVVTLMNQSCCMSPGASKYQSFRLLLGVWIIATFVMTVGFRSQLTSLLNDVPLEGKVVDVTSVDELLSLGFRISVLSYTEEIVLPGVIAGQNVHMGSACFDSSGRIRVRPDGRDTFLVYGSGSKKHETLKGELLSKGYVQMNTKLFAHTSGPEIRTTSPYRRAMGALLSRSFEGGLFARGVRMAVFKFTSHCPSDSATSGNGEEPLGVSSLRPYFCLWVLGIIVSSVAFTAECLVDQYSRRRIFLVRLKRKK